MPTVNINGIEVVFPYEPYEIQRNYMQKVIESLQTGSHAVLESPTGTGKTLSLLCASLAWLLNEKKHVSDNILKLSPENDSEAWNMDKICSYNKSGNVPKIIYSSRTHSQLSQVMQELKRSSYCNQVNATVLGSREQMCLKKEVLEEQSSTARVSVCRMLVKSRQCSMYHGTDKLKDQFTMTKGVVDIEDLVTKGRKQHFCPYYMAREMKQSADIIFMPYNYLLDQNSRKMHGIDIQNCVIIFDEAHNIEKICEESASTVLSSTNISLAIEELTYIMKRMDEEEDSGISFDTEVSKDFTLGDLIVLKETVVNFEKVVDAIPINGAEAIFEGLYILDILRKSGITQENQNKLISICDRLVQFLQTTRSEIFSHKGQHLEQLRDLISHAANTDSPALLAEIKKCFRVHIEEQDIQKSNRSKDGNWSSKPKLGKPRRVISWWCFSSKFGIDMLLQQGVKNIILTSGTLAPLDSFIKELGIEVAVRLENPHIISNDQIFVRVIKNGFNDTLMDPSFNNRSNLSYISDLGRTIKTLAYQVPDGLLVFFPSYTTIESCKNQWQHTGIWTEINRAKMIFVEPRGKDDFSNIMNEYYSQIRTSNGKGACFFAVCRGKVAEGLDFIDENGRAVIITGLPYPPYKDPRVVLKKEYLDKLYASDKKSLKGSDWYSLEATRAVNQAIGRVIRHKKDYGAIFLCDHRCSSQHVQKQLSKWIRGYIQVPNSFLGTLEGLQQFFNDAKSKYPTSKTSTSESVVEKKILESGSSFSNCLTISNKDTQKPSSCNEDYSSYLLPTSSKESDKKCTKEVIDFNDAKPVAINVPSTQLSKKRKLNIAYVDITKPNDTKETEKKKNSTKLYLLLKSRYSESIQKILTILENYQENNNIQDLIEHLHEFFLTTNNDFEFLRGLEYAIKHYHKIIYQKYLEKVIDLCNTNKSMSTREIVNFCINSD